MPRPSTLSAPALPACRRRCKLSARRRRGRARGDRLRRRPLPFLSRCLGRHDHRQRQSSVAVRQSCGARLLRDIGAADRLSARRRRSFPLSIWQAATLDAAYQRRARCRGGFSIRRGACPARACSTTRPWRGCCGASRQDGRRDYRPRDRSISGSSSRSSSPRSTSIRPTDRRSSRPR